MTKPKSPHALTGHRFWCQSFHGHACTCRKSVSGDPRDAKVHPLHHPIVAKKIVVSPSGCWLWGGTILDNGYGQLCIKWKRIAAHRFCYELVKGPIPKGRDVHIDHLCRVRHCVNPAHLEVVTERENIMRGYGVGAINARKTHCRRGHPFAENATVNERGYRRCRPCDAMRQRNWLRARHAV